MANGETYDRALMDTVEEALGTLTEREAKVLRLYFALDGKEPMTLGEIGSLLGIHRERVRKIKEKALLRLRDGSRARFREPLQVVSGREAVKAFGQLGYEADRQRGSHIILRQTEAPQRRLTIPDHKRLRKGALRALVRQAGLSVEDFMPLL